MYYLGYAPMQIPIGLLLDHWGPKKTMTLGAGICLVGVFLTSMASHFWVLCVSRFLFGLGASVFFVGPIRLSTAWFAPYYVAFMVGMIAAVGKLGGMCANLFLPKVMEWSHSWKSIMIYLGVIGIIIAVPMMLTVKDTPKGSFVPAHKGLGIRHVMKEVWAVLSSRTVWLAGFYGFIMYMPMSVLSDTWAASFVRKLFDVSDNAATGAAAMIAFGSCIGAPTVAWLSSKLGSRILFMRTSAVIAFIISIFLFFWPPSSFVLYQALLFLMGFVCTGQILVFAVGMESVPSGFSGTANGIVNTLVMGGGLVLTPAIGSVMDIVWKLMRGELGENGMRIYTLGHYRFAFSILCIGIALAFLVTFFIPETLSKNNKRAMTSARKKINPE